MKKLHTLTAIFALAFTTLLSGSALADTVGTTGRAVKVRVNASGSSDYSKFHGSAQIKTPGKNGATKEYKWGGTDCPGKDLNEHQVQLLVDAVVNRRNVHVTPRTKNGNGGAKCLVAFDITKPIKAQD